MKLYLSLKEAKAVEYCLSMYLDNEYDKGDEGIGSDIIDSITPFLELTAAGSLQGPVEVDLVQLALIFTALDIYQDEDFEPDAGFDGDVVKGLIKRIESAVKPII